MSLWSDTCFDTFWQLVVTAAPVPVKQDTVSSKQSLVDEETDSGGRRMLPTNGKYSDVQQHPLWMPVLNAMVECSTAGIADELSCPLLLQPIQLRLPIAPHVDDQKMFELLESQWADRNELERFHSSLKEFCHLATENLSRSTEDLVNQTSRDFPLQDFSGRSPVALSLPEVDAPYTRVPTEVTDHPSFHGAIQPLEPLSECDPARLFRLTNSPPLSRSIVMSATKPSKTLPEEATDILKGWIMSESFSSSLLAVLTLL